MGLNSKQEIFALEYLSDLNAAAAYRRAGYRARGNAVEVNASRLLRNAQVKEFVERELAHRKERLK